VAIAIADQAVWQKIAVLWVFKLFSERLKLHMLILGDRHQDILAFLGNGLSYARWFKSSV